MNTDDQRNVICGGDPDNYIKAYFKGLYFDLDDNDEIKILFLKEKFPFSREKFSDMAAHTKLSLTSYSENGTDIEIIIKK
ncbi:MAG: hypothetical protein QXZ44_04670 [Ferroplasma sp.]